MEKRQAGRNQPLTSLLAYAILKKISKGRFFHMIKIVAKAKVKPDCKEKFKELARPLVSASQAEAGNISYHLHESCEDPYTMAFIEVWKDQAAIDFHNATEHFMTICPQFAELFDGPMDVTHYVEVV